MKSKKNIRRGLLELDLILKPFYENVYDNLNHHKRIKFDVLLGMDDIELLNLIINSKQTNNKEVSELLRLINLHSNY